MNVHQIRTESDYDTALGEVEQLWGSRLGTPNGDHLDVLIVLIQEYEAKHHPIDTPDPVDNQLPTETAESHAQGSGAVIGRRG